MALETKVPRRTGIHAGGVLESARLILRDRAVRRLGPWLLVAVLLGLMLASNQQDAVRHGLTVGAHGFQGFRYVAYLPWGAIAGFLVYAGVTVRCERLNATLPLSHRTLWLCRVGALTLSSWALIGTMAAALLLRNWIEGFEVVGRTRVDALFAQLAAASLLAVVLARLPQPALHALPHRPGTIVYLAGAWGGILGLLFLLAGEAPGYALLPAVAALLLGLWIYLSLPSSPLLASWQPEEAPAPTAQETRGEIDAGESLIHVDGSSRWLVQATLWRTCHGHWVSWLLLAACLLLLVGLARGDPGSGLDGGSIFVLLWLLLNASFGASVSRLHVLDPLPLPRRRIFAYAVLPGLLVASLGYVGAMALRTRWERGALLVDYRRHSVTGEVDVRVPLAFWEIGWEGQPAPVEAPYVPPWEEPHYPWSTTLYRGGSAVLYSPYHVPEDSPPDVVAEALSRAVADVYGARIPAEEIERRYLIGGAGGGTAVRGGGLDLLHDFPELRPNLWLRVAPVGVLLLGVPWLLFLAATVRGGYLRADAGRQPWAPLFLAGLLALCLLGILWSNSAGYTTAWKLAALVQILLRKASFVLPGGPIAWWAVIVLLDTGAYLLARARFVRAEAPASSP